MVAVTVVAALAVLALVTQAGVMLVQRAHPASGVMVGVAGASLHIVELGPRDAAGPPIVLLHGASSISKRCGGRSASTWRKITA